MGRHWVRGHYVRGHFRNGSWVEGHWRGDHSRMSTAGAGRKQSGGCGPMIVFLSLVCLLGSCLSWCGSSNNEAPAADEEQRERALAILDEQTRSTPSSSPWPIVGWADTPASARANPASASCRIEKEAYGVWRQGLDPITSGLRVPAPAELRRLKQDAEEYTLAVAPLADPKADQLILAITSYRAAVVSAMIEPDGLHTLESMVTAGLAINGEHRSFQAGCGG